MTPAEIKVSDTLIRKRGGITFEDFPLGFRLGARIYDLRLKGFDIHTIMEECGERKRARYVLRNIKKVMGSAG